MTNKERDELINLSVMYGIDAVLVALLPSSNNDVWERGIKATLKSAQLERMGAHNKIEIVIDPNT